MIGGLKSSNNGIDETLQSLQQAVSALTLEVRNIACQLRPDLTGGRTAIADDNAGNSLGQQGGLNLDDRDMRDSNLGRKDPCNPQNQFFLRRGLEDPIVNPLQISPLQPDSLYPHTAKHPHPLDRQHLHTIQPPNLDPFDPFDDPYNSNPIRSPRNLDPHDLSQIDTGEHWSNDEKDKKPQIDDNKNQICDNKGGIGDDKGWNTQINSDNGQIDSDSNWNVASCNPVALTRSYPQRPDSFHDPTSMNRQTTRFICIRGANKVFLGGMLGGIQCY